MKSFKTVLAFLFLATSALAQSTTSSAATPGSTAGISPCILGCTVSAATANNCTIDNLQCLCTSKAFQAAAQACLIAKCSASDQAAALALQEQECASISSGAPSSAPPSAHSSESSSSRAATSTAPSSRVTGTPTASSSRSESASGSASNSGTATSAAPAKASNASVRVGEGLGLAGAILAGVVGLVL
ncbi:hypothetical protein DXG03_004368 [Asterophora parasitica]|uniref:CFEM domain-containing protein n=1 Tax=Asterophora parasitica TaxID=117018 RepID=A0A9P7GAT6_9AGAR|nr:hypothetical protein DXG03_004368 [Asterophora parasitica]